MNLLVTGGAGFIGSSYVRLARRKRPDALVVNVDALTYAGNLENLTDLEGDAKHVFVRGDIRDGAAMLEILRGYKHRGDRQLRRREPRRSRASCPPTRSSTPTSSGRSGCSRRRAPPASSASSRSRPTRSTARWGRRGRSRRRPSSPRAARIRPARRPPIYFVLAFHHTLGMDVVVTRCSNNYGPYQFPEKLIPLMITQRDARTSRCRSTATGMNVRDWIHVEDHCDGAGPGAREGRGGRGLQHRRRERAAEHRGRARDPRDDRPSRIA